MQKPKCKVQNAKCKMKSVSKLRRVLGGQEGIVLPVVVAVIAVITTVGFTAASVVGDQAMMGSRYTGGEEALAYAEAGLYKYLWHLNKDSKYYEKDEADKGPDEALLGVETPFQDGYYYLEVDPPTADEPVVTIRSTGWPASDPTNRRTIEVQVHKRQFCQHVYLSNEEKVWWNGEFHKVWWYTDDEVHGPLHTNHTLHIYGRPIFHGPVTYTIGIELWPGSNPDYRAGPPQQTPPLTFPPSNSQLMTQAQYQGYYYQGRTCIFIDGDQLRIRNQAGDIEVRPLPSNGVIYVNGTVDYDEDRGEKWQLDKGNVFIAGELDGRLTVAAANNIYVCAKDPTDYDYWTAEWAGGVRYANEDFDPDGGMTDDMLGLVANGYVRILHYYWPDDSYDHHSPYFSRPPYDVAPYNITIHGAVFALDWSWEYEYFWDRPVKGTIYLVGSIIQQYRGGVGTFYSGSGAQRSGYLKDYRHDPRMLYDTPPHFLEPVNAGWQIVSWDRI